MNVTHNCPIEKEKQLVVGGTVKKNILKMNILLKYLW
jgi:hypothetical protein